MRTEEISVAELFPAAALTATANGTGVDLASTDGPFHREMQAVLDIGAVAGTTPSATVKLQSSPDNSTWSDVLQADGVTTAAFAAQTAVGVNEMQVRIQNRYVRAVATISGTSPSFTMCVLLLGQKRIA